MPDIGLGEVVVIAVLALLVFGPDRLPKVAADAGRMLRQLRELASNARRDLVDAAGLQDDGDVRAVVNQLDPRQVLRPDAPAPVRPATSSVEASQDRATSAVDAAGASQPAAAATDKSTMEDWT